MTRKERKAWEKRFKPFSIADLCIHYAMDQQKKTQLINGKYKGYG